MKLTLIRLLGGVIQAVPSVDMVQYSTVHSTPPNERVNKVPVVYSRGAINNRQRYYIMPGQMWRNMLRAKDFSSSLRAANRTGSLNRTDTLYQLPGRRRVIALPVDAEPMK